MSKEIKDEFEGILTNYSWWRRFIGSQLVDGLSVFIGQITARCYMVASRALQESFLSQATKPSSILAGAEDKGYVGLKISPSVGVVTIRNKTNERISIPTHTPVISKELIDYTLLSVVDLNPQESIDININQTWLETITTTVQSSSSWQSILLPRDLTAETHKVEVYVDGELWENRPKFRSATGTSKVYMEYYKASEQLGIRFGNNINGKAPNKDSIITLKVWCTNGTTTLLNDQQLQLVDELEYLNEFLEIRTKTAITGGAVGSSIEEIRNGALYATAYDDQIAWDGDYRTFISNNIGGIKWLSVWGEKEQERLDGVKKLENINRIFFSAYSDIKDESHLENEILTLFSGREGYNENYMYKNRVDDPYTITVSGIVFPYSTPKDAEVAIRSALAEAFGKNVKDKPQRVFEKDIWQEINKLCVSIGIEEFTLTVTDLNGESIVGHYSYLDIDACTITFNYKSVL